MVSYPTPQVRQFKGLRRKRFLLLSILFAVFQLVACGVFDQPPPTNQVYFSQELFANKNTAPGWFAYGMALSSWEPTYLSNGKLNYYDREVFARAEAATIWKQLREKGDVKADKDLDALWAVNAAGFMPEYVWLYLKRRSFQNPGNLRLDAFRAWAKAYLPQHEAVENPGVFF
jgi:hypothetical protein